MRIAILFGLMLIAMSNGLVIPDDSTRFLVGLVAGILVFMDLIDFFIHVARFRKGDQV